MSTLAITAAHFVAFPVRYAVGRWCNIPTDTLLAYNAADLGLNILFISVVQYVATHHWKMSKRLATSVFFTVRTVFFLTAVYATSKLTNPISIESAALTNLASLVSVNVAMRFV